MEPEGNSLRERMMQVSRLATLGEMVTGIAHELNQPLTAIANYAQACTRLLGKGGPELADVREALEEITSQAVRAGGIIQRFRDLVRTQQMQRAPADVNALVQEVLCFLRADAQAHRVHLRLELAADLPWVSVDEVQIQHVLLNLMRNAIEALEGVTGTREVLIRTVTSAQYDVEICVSDTGPGVDEAIVGQIFDPFFSTKPAGTGLGLSISHTIARLHQGSLGHRPNAPRGASFFLRLPQVDKSPS